MISCMANVFFFNIYIYIYIYCLSVCVHEYIMCSIQNAILARRKMHFVLGCMLRLHFALFHCHTVEIAPQYRAPNEKRRTHGGKKTHSGKIALSIENSALKIIKYISISFLS